MVASTKIVSVKLIYELVWNLPPGLSPFFKFFLKSLNIKIHSAEALTLLILVLLTCYFPVLHLRRLVNVFWMDKLGLHKHKGHCHFDNMKTWKLVNPIHKARRSLHCTAMPSAFNRTIQKCYYASWCWYRLILEVPVSLVSIINCSLILTESTRNLQGTTNQYPETI